MTEQEEYAAEILRMVERYKAGDSKRRVPMLEAAQMPGQPAGNARAIPSTPFGGPDADEYAYLGTPSPPVQHAGSMLPRGMGQQYGPIPMPGMLDPRLGPQIPQGYTEGDDRRIRDPNGNPAWFQEPSRQAIAKDVSAAAFPGAFGLARSALPPMKQPGMDRNVVIGKGVMEVLKKLNEDYKRPRHRSDDGGQP